MRMFEMPKILNSSRLPHLPSNIMEDTAEAVVLKCEAVYREETMQTKGLQD